MIYVQVRYYFYTLLCLPIMQSRFCPEKVKMAIALWGLSVMAKTMLWKIKSGHTK